MGHKDDPRYQDHKDKTVLYYALGKAMFDSTFRERIFEDPERAANSTGLDKCVVDSLRAIGKEALEGFAKTFDETLQSAAMNASFC